MVEEIFELIKKQSLNEKNNNYIFSNLSKEDIERVVNYSKGKKTIISNYDEIKYDYYVSSEHLDNVIIDLDLDINDFFNNIFSQLNINDNLLFNNYKDILNFRKLLLKYKKMVQLIIYNAENIKEEDQQLINEMFKFNTFAFNIICLLNGKNLVTYKTTKEYILDCREDYMKF